MKNRALIGLSAACMSALVATAVGCGEPIHEPYTPPEKDAVEQAQPAADKAEEEKAAADLSKEEAENPNADVADAADEAEASVDEKVAADEEKAADEADGAAKEAEGQAEDEAASEAEKVDAQEGDKAGADAEADNADKAAAEAGYADGEYTATGKGIGGDVPVTVTVKDGKISDVTVGDNSETQGIGSKAIEQLPAEIVKANGTEGVDAVSGATITSKAIFSAVEDALAQAGEGSAAPANDAEKVEAPAGYADGTYEATGKGIGGDVPVTVEVKDGKIASVTVGDNSETQGIGSKAIEQLPEAIVAAGGTEGVDAVSGATITSKAIFSAVDECLAQASSGDAAADAATDEKVEKADESLKAGDETEAEAEDAKKQDEAVGEEVAKDAQKVADDEAKADAEADAKTEGALKDGEYTATGKGIGGDVPVTVTVKDGKISDVTVGDNSETQGIGSKAIEQLPEAIVAAGGTEGVDAVSGATITSKAIFSAVDECLAQASSGDAAADAATDEKAEPAADADKKDDAKVDDKKAEDKAEPAADADKKADDQKADEKAEPAADAKADDQKAEPAPDAKADSTAAVLADGEYTATGKGIGGDVPVTVTVKDGKISDVTVGDNSETQGIGSKAIEQLPEAIVAAGGTEGVDAVSGATITSKAIFSAVDECLAQASSGDAAADAATDEKAEPAADADKKDDAKVDDKKAEDKAEPAADADKKADDQKADEKAEPAADAKADDQKAEPAPDAKADSTAAVLADGEYTATGKGIGGDVPVTVTVKDGKISDVTVGDNSETQGIGSKAIEQLPEAIVAAGGTEGVDAVSGATITSKAIFSAVDECLAQASSGDAAADAATDEKAEPAADADKKDDAKVDDKKAEDKAEPAADADKKADDQKADEKAEPAADAKADDQKADEKAEPAADAKADDQKAEPAPDAKADSTAAVLADGEYTATGKGIGGDVPVTVTVKDGKISDVTVGDNSETQGIGSKAIEQLPEAIVAAGGTEGVDAVSGATITSKAIFSAVERAPWPRPARAVPPPTRRPSLPPTLRPTTRRPSLPPTPTRRTTPRSMTRRPRTRRPRTRLSPLLTPTRRLMTRRPTRRPSLPPTPRLTTRRPSRLPTPTRRLTPRLSPLLPTRRLTPRLSPPTTDKKADAKAESAAADKKD